MSAVTPRYTMSATGGRRAPPPSRPPPGGALFIKAGFPLILFTVMASYVVSSAVEGKNKERDAVKGVVSKSERQARMEKEKEDMMEKITKIRKTDFDNTKRIERPEDILERRKRERDQRNRWYNRLGRWIAGK